MDRTLQVAHTTGLSADLDRLRARCALTASCCAPTASCLPAEQAGTGCAPTVRGAVRSLVLVVVGR